jgi:3-oxoacyl-[acyl-carrier protein] reductase
MVVMTTSEQPDTTNSPSAPATFASATPATATPATATPATATPATATPTTSATLTTSAAPSTPATPRTAIVTGGSAGIGRAIGLRLGRDGWNVAVAYRSHPESAAEVVAEIGQQGGHAVAVQADVSRRADVAALFDRTEQEFGPVSALVANAGVSRVAPVAGSDDTMVTELLGVNLLGTLYGLQEAARRLRPGGSIVTLSSTAVLTATPGLGVYAAAKAGVETLTRVAARELGPAGLRVNAVAPGLVDSPMFRAGKTDADLDRFRSQAPLRRLGRYDEIAEAVAYLVSPGASWVSGQILRVNGGAA